MDHATEVTLMEELMRLHSQKSAFLDESVSHSPALQYFDEEIFQAEQARIFRQMPHALAHISELPKPGSFIRRQLAGLPVLLTRDEDNQIHAFLNVCRHRGTQLESATEGCKHRFSCPYHAWTWDNRGELLRIPHEDQGFPAMDKKALGLKRLGCVNKYGMIWVSPMGEETPDVDEMLAGLGQDFDWVDIENAKVTHSEEKTWAVNWKIVTETGLEAYHFRVAHRKTIAPYFHDNLSSYQQFGPHIRSILAKKTLTELADTPREHWRVRDHAQVLYTVFPSSAFLVQSDHVFWLQMEALSPSSTRIRMHTLVPKDRAQSVNDLAHWQKNHHISVATLTEDFEIGEKIQLGLDSGANTDLLFGRFEGALAALNATIKQALKSAN